jgi:hypothetical protein
MRAQVHEVAYLLICCILFSEHVRIAFVFMFLIWVVSDMDSPVMYLGVCFEALFSFFFFTLLSRTCMQEAYGDNTEIDHR